MKYLSIFIRVALLALGQSLQCQWSKPDGYGKISQCITTTKHSKAKTVCIFLGIYCKPWIPANAISLHSVIAMVDITISCKQSVSLLWIYSPLCQIKVCTWWIPANTISFHLIMAMLAIIRFNKQSMSLSALKKARGDKWSLIEDNNKHIRGIFMGLGGGIAVSSVWYGTNLRKSWIATDAISLQSVIARLIIIVSCKQIMPSSGTYLPLCLCDVNMMYSCKRSSSLIRHYG